MKSFAALLVGVVVGMLLTAAPFIAAGSDENRVLGVYRDGFLEQQNGVLILHEKGEPYEMGYQYGYLLGDRINSLIPLMKTKLAEMYDFPASLTDVVRDVIVAAYSPFFPAVVIDELTGILDGADEKLGNRRSFSMNDLIMANSLVDAGGTFDFDIFACSGFAAWGPLTEGGKVFSTRNIDLFTGYGLENYTLVSIIKEKGRTPVANIGFTGFIGCMAGLSGKGLSFAQIWAYSTDREFGTPWPLTVRNILQTGDSVDDAVTLLQQATRTYGANFVFSDGRNGAGVTIETTAHLLSHFADDDPGEDAAVYDGQCYAIKVPHAVFRASIALDPQIRQLQYDVNGPDGDPRTTDSYQQRYKGQADRIIAYRDQGILIGAEEARAISMAAAEEGESMLCTVYANTDLEFWVAYSAIDGSGVVHDANTQPYKHVNFAGYLPTLDLAMNKTEFRPGDHLDLSVTSSNLGPETTGDFYLGLKVGEDYYFYPDFSLNPVPQLLSLESNETNRPRVQFGLDFDLRIPAGEYQWIAAIVDPLDGHLVDLVQQTFIFWR